MTVMAIRVTAIALSVMLFGVKAVVSLVAASLVMLVGGTPRRSDDLGETGSSDLVVTFGLHDGVIVATVVDTTITVGVVVMFLSTVLVNDRAVLLNTFLDGAKSSDATDAVESRDATIASVLMALAEEVFTESVAGDAETNTTDSIDLTIAVTFRIAIAFTKVSLAAIATEAVNGVARAEALTVVAVKGTESTELTKATALAIDVTKLAKASIASKATTSSPLSSSRGANERRRDSSLEHFVFYYIVFKISVRSKLNTLQLQRLIITENGQLLNKLTVSRKF